MPTSKYKIPTPSAQEFNQLFRQAAQGGQVPGTVVENIYTAAERPSIQYKVPGKRSARKKRDTFIRHEMVERLLLQKLGGKRTAPLKATKEQQQAAHQFAAAGEWLARPTMEAGPPKSKKLRKDLRRVGRLLKL